MSSAKRLKVSYMPLADWPRGVEELHAGAVGLLFLRALIGEQRAADHLLRRHGSPAGGRLPPALPPVARPPTIAPTPSSMRDDRGGLRVGELLAQPRQVAARHMAGLVRQHADDLVRRLAIVQRADIDEDAPAVHHEGVERAVVDQHDLDVLLREAGGACRIGAV